MDDIQPVAIQKLDEKTLQILWTDETKTKYNVRLLRYNCSCAHCVNEWTGERSNKLEDIPEEIKPKKLDSVGNYAIKITWSDGHDAGIYTYKSLRFELNQLQGESSCSSKSKN